MLDKIKVARRISHNLLDEEINDTILVARAELIRSGVDKTIAESNDVLICSAIKSYCLYSLEEDEKKKDGFWKSWEYQLDCLRKSTGYRKEGGTGV